MTYELRNQRNIIANHKLVLKLMREAGISGELNPKKYKSYRGETGRATDNILDRNFHAENPLEKLCTDITEMRVGGVKLYLSALIDLYNGEIAAWNLSKHPTVEQVLRMIDQVEKKIPKGQEILIHSDQGYQYTSKKYQEKIRKNNWIQSMSRKGNCLDNSIIENFFGIMKREYYNRYNFNNIEDFAEGLSKYMHYYNNRRIKSRLKMSPVQYRTQYEKAA